MGQYVTVEATKPTALMARLLNEDGDAYVQAGVEAVVYSVVLLGVPDETDETALTGFTAESLSPSEVIFDTLQTPVIWTADDTGFNFKHYFNTSPFTLAGRAYKTTYTLTTTTGTVTAEFFVTTHPASASDGYCVRADIESIFGHHNVQKWADVENHCDGAHIGGRIAKAIGVATAEIDDQLRGGPYTVPIVGVTIPTTVVQLTASLAGVWLYESRGVEDFDETTGAAVHRLAWHRDHVSKVLAEITRGHRRLNLATATNIKGTRVPVVSS